MEGVVGITLALAAIYLIISSPSDGRPLLRIWLRARQAPLYLMASATLLTITISNSVWLILHL